MDQNEFKLLLNNLGLNMKDLAALTNISYSTISKYGNQNPVPAWVEPFLHIYKQNEDLKDVKQLIKDLAAKID